jgi:acetyl-CoA C-acetyltransferase
MDASRAIACGDGRLMIACGVESMTRAPFVMPKASTAFDRQSAVYDTTMGWRFINPALSQMYYPYTMGETAENVARQWNISRVAQDEFAWESQQKYDAALKKNRFHDEIIPVQIQVGKDQFDFDQDEHPRLSSLEKLAQLKPAFINDGAAAMLLASSSAVKEFGLTPMARVRNRAVAGVEPSVMGIGPVPATQKVLHRAGISVADLDLIELNEAFASQSIACIHDLGFDLQRVNVNGGAIALGHPLGCSGVRISTTLLHEMKKRKSRYGLATMCVGVGQGSAILFEGLQ